jgi:hypothetical protein
MSKHEKAVELMLSLLREPNTNLNMKTIPVHGQIIDDHLDDFEKWFKTDGIEFNGIGYMDQETGKYHRERSAQFLMFAIGRESLLLKQEKQS